MIGGLGSATSDLMSRLGVSAMLTKLGIRDTYLHGASAPYLMLQQGIDSSSIAAAIGSLIGIADLEPSDEVASAPQHAPRTSDTPDEDL